MCSRMGEPDRAAGAPAGTAAGEAAAPTPRETPARTIDDSDFIALRERMGQTGYEAGDPDARPRDKVYVKTSKSFNINAYLRSDGAEIRSPYSDWDRYGFSRADAAAAVRQIDAGMKPLPESIKLTRFVDGDALGAILGNPAITAGSIQTFLQQLAGSADSQSLLRGALQAANYVEKGYSSTTYLQSHPSYDARDIRLNIVARPGTPAIMTANHAEHEVLIGRSVKYNFTGGFKIVQKGGHRQLILDVEI